MNEENRFTPEYNANLVSRTFTSKDEADRAYNYLIDRGYSDRDITVLMSDKTRDEKFSENDDSKLNDSVADSAGKGSLIGGGIGAVVGAIAAIGSNVIFPGLGLVVAGPLAAGLAGAGTGAVAGGLIGALTGAGASEEEAEYYNERVKEGDIYIGVKPKDENDGRVIYDRWYDNQNRM